MQFLDLGTGVTHSWQYQTLLPNPSVSDKIDVLSVPIIAENIATKEQKKLQQNQWAVNNSLYLVFLR